MPIGLFRSVMSVGAGSSAPSPAPLPPLLWYPLVRYVGSNATVFSGSSVAVNDDLIFFGVNRGGASRATRDNGQTFTTPSLITAGTWIRGCIGSGARMMMIQESPSRAYILSDDGFETALASNLTASAAPHSLTNSSAGDLIAILYNCNICGYSNSDVNSYSAFSGYTNSGLVPLGSGIAVANNNIYFLAQRTDDSNNLWLVSAPISEFRAGSVTTITNVLLATGFTTLFEIGDRLFATFGNDIYRLSVDELSLELVASDIYPQTTTYCATSNGTYAVITARINATTDAAIFDGTTVVLLPRNLNNGSTNGVNVIGVSGNVWASISGIGYASVSLGN